MERLIINLNESTKIPLNRTLMFCFLFKEYVTLSSLNTYETLSDYLFYMFNINDPYSEISYEDLYKRIVNTKIKL